MLYLNLIETELEWLLYQLWSKTTIRAPKFSFRIADTVILRHGLPAAWYYSAHDGSIKAKRKLESLKFSAITQAFLAKTGALNEEPAATSYLY